MFKFSPEPVDTRATRFTLHYLDDAAVLFDAAARRLHDLNATAAYIWSCLEQGLAGPAIARNLCATFGFPQEAAEAHVRDVLASRHRLRLVTTPEAGTPPQTARTKARRQAEATWASEHAYRLLDSTFRLRCSPSVPGDELARAFAMLRVDSADRGATDGPAIDVELTSSGERFSLQLDGETTDRCWRADQVLPMVKARFVAAALRRGRDLFAVHAAAVSRGRSCLLIPGASGSGLSTFAAALAADGFRLLGDDTVVLARRSLRVRPMALPICLQDGTRARYMRPPGREPASSRRVTAIVFPCRTASLDGGLAALPKPEALTRLVRGLCPLGDELDARVVERFVRWIEELACYELRYADPDEAVGRLRALCSIA